MATVTGLTAARMKELSDAYITDATVNTVGNLILTTAGGTSIDAGPVILYGTTSQYYRGDKTWQTLNKAAVGLSNVDNVSVVSSYVPKWVPNTTYLADDLVLSPYGQLLRANSTLLSPASFSTTGWTNVTPGPPTVRTNLATNPAMKGVGALAVMRTNLATNPSSNGSSTTGWTPARTTITAPAAAITGLTQQYFRVTLTDVVAGSYFQRVDMSGIPVTAGVSYSLSLWMRNVAAPRQAGAQLIFLNASSVQVGSAVVGVVNGTAWSKLSTTMDAPATATQALIRIGVPTQSSWVAGDFFDFGAVLFEASGVVGTYIDGAVAAAGDFSYAWSGTAYNSTSQQKALPVSGVTISPGNSGAAYHHKTVTDAPPGHTDSVKMVWTQASTGGSPGISYTTQQGGLSGDIITAKLWVKFDTPRNIKLLVRPRLASTNVVVDATTTVSVPANTWTELSQTVTATGTYDNILIWALPVTPGFTFVAGNTAGLGKILIEKAPFAGDYFDGSTASSEDVLYSWAGTASASASTATPSTSVRQWRGGRVYAAGEQVISPRNELVTSKTARTSGTTWTNTEAGNWTGYDQAMVFSNGGFSWGGGAAWDAGTLSLDASQAASYAVSPGAAFAVAGSLSGTLKFQEPGIYDVIWDTGASGEVGNAGYRINTSGTWPGPPDSMNGILGEGIHMANQTYYEKKVMAIGIRVPQAGLEIRLTGLQTNGTTNVPRVRVIKRASI